MASKTNAKSVKETLEDRLKGDAKLVSSFGKLAGFAAAVAAGDPLSLAMAVAKIGDAAGAALDASSEILTRVAGEQPTGKLTAAGNFERFKVVFYTACARAYIETISSKFGEFASKVEANKESKPEVALPAGMKERMQQGIANITEAEVTFLFGVEPLAGNVPLFSAYSDWLIVLLVATGVNELAARSFVMECEKEARSRFRVFLTGDDPVADWTRRYLAVTRAERTSEVLEGLASVADSLKDWTEPFKELKKREREAWRSYREMLIGLPDMKETMFNEQFGVRKVFVKPEVNYHVAGASGDAGKPQKSPDIGSLIGALISTRTSGDDLIILCGGPGSGKSTLCRILAAQLAQDDNVHPIFVRLRRLKEGADIGAFIEESLQKLGAITRLSDLRTVPNLVIILDGFDELVMASRARLRQFFNILREEHSSGALRGSKIIVSGRDTLFPHGDGLPTGSHVVTLLPFDKPRVQAWCTKWRAVHTTGPGCTFEAAQFLDSSARGRKGSPLHHLITWPLTLHLVARVHTTGLLDLAPGGEKRIEKAYLYRSILAETAKRQEEQADTAGRLGPVQMREFLRDLAWQMYAESRDSMDPAEVMPLLAKHFKDKPDAELSELADVAVVNSPELSKGEETGFEFVHKSFAEYLVAERMAHSLEMAIFKAAAFGTDELTWRMSDEDATRELAPYLASRLLTEEVQEMLEPMLGGFVEFLKGGRVSEIVSGAKREDGLRNIIDRLEALYRKCVQGEQLGLALGGTGKRQETINPLETIANYAAGIVLIGTAAARQLSSLKTKPERVTFNASPFEGAFWRWSSILSAGGLQIDRRLAERLYEGLSGGRSGNVLDDRLSPLKTGWMARIHGYRATLSELVASLESDVRYLQILNVLISAYYMRTLDHLRAAPVDPRVPMRLLHDDIPRMLEYSVRETTELNYRNSGVDSFHDTGLLADFVFRAPRQPELLARGLMFDRIDRSQLEFLMERAVEDADFAHGNRGRSRVSLLRELVRRIEDIDAPGRHRTSKPKSQ